MKPPNATREGDSELVDGNQNVPDAEHFEQNGTAGTIKYSNDQPEDDNSSSNASWRNRDDMGCDRSVPSVDDCSIKSGDDSDGADSTQFPCLENDAIWIPPEAADKDDETEIVARNIDYDDDDDYSDGIKWGQSSFSATGEEHQAGINPGEEREKAMLEAMNGQLKILVSRFLASADISFPKGESSESWLDIVTSLSWKAALLIKPDASMGKEMDPGSYIKVKCVASGTRRQSEVIKGLVFKRNTAHKHMPTKCDNPRLLLLKGVLGHSDVGLSSFNSMEQEKDHLEKAISKMMSICGPNVIMVEKTVSRDIQELLLKEGATLILDMKLNRLERIARCTGSPIISFSEVLDTPKLRQCDYFHIEKFIEEHNNTGEGGKRPSKTLLFLEGFPRPLGCTILLRGSNSEELKKVKQVMHYTVFAAYHLILETSFFEDQRVFLNDNASKEETSVITNAGPLAAAYDVAVPSNGPISGSPTDNDVPELRLHLATSNGSAGNTALSFPTNADSLNLPTSMFSNELGEVTSIRCDSTPPLNSERPLSPVPGSLRKFIDMFCHQNIYLPVTSLQEITDHQKEGRFETSQAIVSNGFHAGAKVVESADSSENMEDTNDLGKQQSVESRQELMLTDASVCEKHDESPVLLENGEQHSTSCISKEKIVDEDEVDDALDSQSILILMSSQCITKQAVCDQSHLSRIKYYGNFDVSLGRYLQEILQNQKKLSCSSYGEPHVYSYTHRNGNLNVLVRHLMPQHHLPGESEGKIWMWTRCLRCEQENGISESTPRVLISSEARNLSFGKFLELSFSSHSAARRLSICGHLVNRDCLRFFGLGSKVAMFRYSPVEIYAACKPQPTLQFHNPNRQDWFKEEEKNILARGVLLFSEVTSLLQHLKDQYPDVTTINCGALLPVTEFSQLEELLIKEKARFVGSLAKAVDQGGIPSSSYHELLNVNWFYQELLLELYMWDHRLNQLLECKPSREESIAACKNPADMVDKISVGTFEIDRETDIQSAETAAPLVDGSLGDGHLELSCSGSDRDKESSVAPRVQVDNTIHTPRDHSFEISGEREVQGNGLFEHSKSMEQECMIVPKQFSCPDWDDRERWIWSPFCEARLAYRRDIQIGRLEKFELINHYYPTHLSPLYKQSNKEVDTPQFTVGLGGNILRVLEDEISSIISHVLAISEESRHLMDTIAENETEDARGEHAKTIEKSYSLISEGSFTSSSWSSIGSFESEASYSSTSSSLSSDDSSNYDSLPLWSFLHPEISVNGKLNLKAKYSVTCIYANHFYKLRKKCCPSELSYITSLSRCKKWDAQGGKSKAFFAKTMDDRFIIKQIKKTEFESFIKFGPDYFKHIYHSLDTGSQTCLAKILGIYQVKQIRHGKEVKIDLMVMENLLFGHSISRIYDLKGVVFSRHISNSNDRDTVYLDQNFVEDMGVSPIYIGGRTKHLLQRAIWNDTSFLTSINVMDYSLLVGVDKEKHELVFGIIDYLRQYTWDKQLETWVKTSLVVPKNVSPTVISPKEYKKRFRKFMTKYFLTVPDTWSPENYSESSKCCGHDNNKLVVAHSEKPLQHPVETCA